MSRQTPASIASRSLTQQGFEIVTPAQLRVLHAVDVLCAGGSRGAGVRQLMALLGAKSPYFVHQCLRKLEACGLVRHEWNKARTLMPSFRFVPASKL